MSIAEEKLLTAEEEKLLTAEGAECAEKNIY
jgi:hypothetical protein